MNWSIFFHNLFLYQDITGATINNVCNPSTLRVTIFTLSGVAFVGALIFYRRIKRPLRLATSLAAVVSFLVGGFAYAVHSDLGWARWVAKDYRLLAGRSLREKEVMLEGPLYDFVLLARRTMPGDYTMLNDNSGNYWTRRFEYLMLPQRKRDHASYIGVIDDPGARYEPSAGSPTRGTFVRKGKMIPNVRLVSRYLDAYILKRP